MRQPNRPRRPIDRFRDGPAQAEVGGGTGAIVTMITTEHTLYFVTERGFSSSQLADQIDPERINANLPQVIQRLEFAYGAETPFVERTICTGAELFNPTYLPERVSKDAAMAIILKIAREFAAVSDTIAELAASEAETRGRWERDEIPAGIIPTTPALRSRVEQAIANLRAVQIEAQRLADLFYPRVPPNLPFGATLLAKVTATFPADDPALENIQWAVSLLERIADHRNAMIHNGEAGKSLTITDYDLQANGVHFAPTLEIVHPRSPVERQDVVHYLKTYVDDLSFMVEMFIVVFCDKNVRQIMPGLISRVVRGDLHDGTRFRWGNEWAEGFPLGPNGLPISFGSPDPT